MVERKVLVGPSEVCISVALFPCGFEGGLGVPFGIPPSGILNL